MHTKKDVKEHLYTALQEIGLSEQEMNLYVLCLSHGPAPIAVFADQLGISRPNIYKLIRGLEEHGLAKFSERKKYARTFMVEPPAALLKQLQEKKEGINLLTHTVTGLMPDLYGLYHQGEDQTKVRVLRTEKEYITAVTELLNQVDREVCFFGSFDDFMRSVTVEGFRQFTSLRIERGITSKTLLLPTKHEAELRKTKHDDLREIRILRKSLNFNASFQLSKHTVIVWLPTTPLALLIEDESMAMMLQAVFELLWNTSAV